MRGGEWVNISINDILVGDIQYVDTGEIVSVDGILIEAFSVVTDESAMTG